MSKPKEWAVDAILNVDTYGPDGINASNYRELLGNPILIARLESRAKCVASHAPKMPPEWAAKNSCYECHGDLDTKGALCVYCRGKADTSLDAKALAETIHEQASVGQPLNYIGVDYLEDAFKAAFEALGHAPKVDVEKLRLFELLETRATQICIDNNISVFQGTALNTVLNCAEHAIPAHLEGGGS